MRPIPDGPLASLLLIVFGGLIIILWLGRGRAFGVLPILAGLALWTQAERPDILIAEDGRLFGIRTEHGRLLSSERGNGFAADSWLENDGDFAPQAAAYARAAMNRGRGRAEYELPGIGAFLYLGSKAPDARSRGACRDAAILLAPNWREAPAGRCLFIGADRLRRDGALAIRIAGGALRVEGAKARNRGRPWTADPGAATDMGRLSGRSSEASATH